MLTRSGTLAILLALVGSTDAADGDRLVKLHAARGLPPVVSATVYRMKDGKRESVVEVAKFDKPFALPDAGPFEVFVKSKGGLPVRVAEKLTVKSGETFDLKIGELLGAIEVFGDNFPRAEKVVLADVRDPGPGEKGHVAVQSAGEYRVDMLVPPGEYAVWVVPANGAKAQRVVENVRVQAGRSIRVGD